MSTEIAVREEVTLSPATQEAVLLGGNLSALKPEQRVEYMLGVCKSLGLNPLTKPFEFITLNGKLVMYAKKDCTEQLRKLNAVSIKIAGRELVEDVYVVTAQATDREGRADESIGAVAIKGLAGEAKANALMKAETKAKRRVTLSISGLGMLDESEVDSVQGAAVVPMPDYAPPTPESQAKLDALAKRTADVLATPRPESAAKPPVAPTRNWKLRDPEAKRTADVLWKLRDPEAAKASAPKASTAASAAEDPAKPAASATATSAASAVASATAGSKSSASSAPAATSSTNTTSTPLTEDPPIRGQAAATPNAGATLFTPPDREPGSDDDEEPAVAMAQEIFPDATEFVDCYKQVRGFVLRDKDGQLTPIGPEPKRTLDQNAKLHALFDELRIPKEDEEPSEANKFKGKQGIRTRIERRFGKTSTAQLSVRECDFLINAMVTQIETNRRLHGVGTPAEREAKWRASGLVQREDGSWGEAAV